MSEYAGYPGGERFEPWQDHEWPEHCGAPSTYVGEVGERELAGLADGDLESFLEEHDVHAPREGETWDSTIHHFRCTSCGWDLVLWDAN